MKLGVEELKESGLYGYYIRSAINVFHHRTSEYI